MARYYGDFRSLDQSVDPKGQKYRVLIFTGYNGVNPYEYTKYGSYPVGNRWIPARYVPKYGTQLTLTDHPVMINYEGGETIYKPHRCSTASISFLRSTFPNDLISINGTSVLVMLLKWKNEVSEVNGHMYNSSTGATLSKITVESPDSTLTDIHGNEVPVVLFHNYKPVDYDKFCYTVEWVGFGTPETFNMGYSHTEDVFTLQCQDALSILKYKKYAEESNDNELINALNMVLEFIGASGTYKHLYITNTVNFPTRYNSASSAMFPATNAASRTIIQSANHFDEDGKAISRFDAIDRVMSFFGLTIIPWKDSIYITTPNSIAVGIGKFEHYYIDSNDLICYGGGTYVKETSDSVGVRPILYDFGGDYTITKESYRSNDMQVSTSDTYNMSKCTVDEYECEDLLPDIEDDKYFEDDKIYMQDFFNVSTGSESEDGQYSWERKYLVPKTDRLICHQYRSDWIEKFSNLVYNPHWECETELTEINYDPKAGQDDDGPGDDGYHRRSYLIGCFAVDSADAEKTPSPNTLPLNTTYHRKFIFNTSSNAPGFFGRWSRNDTPYNHGYNADDKSTYYQILLTVKTGNHILNAGKWLNIIGTWTFYESLRFPMPNNHCRPSSAIPTITSGYHYPWIWAKVKCGNYWLNSTSMNVYTWGTTETYCKLWLNSNIGDQIFDKQFEFLQNKRNIKGITIQLPNSTPMFGRIEVMIDRPLGPGFTIPQCSTLEDFQVNILNSLDPDDKLDDSEYKSEFDNGAISEAPSIDLKNSSLYGGVSYSQVVRENGSYILNMPKVYNVATGNYGQCEQMITEHMMNQYKSPTTNISVTLENKINPYNSIKWQYLPNKKFVPMSMEIDYEYETCRIKATEVKSQNCNPVRQRFRTRNYYRNGDILFDRHPASRRINVHQNDYSPDMGRSILPNSSIYQVRMTTMDEVEANIQISPQFFSLTDNRLMVSIPNELEGVVPSINSEGHLILTFPDDVEE